MHRTDSVARKWMRGAFAAALACAPVPVSAQESGTLPGAAYSQPDTLPKGDAENGSASQLPQAEEANASWLINYELNVTPSEPVTRPEEELEVLPGEFGDDAEGLVYLGDGPPPSYAFGYNRVRSAMTWIPGSDDGFGWFSYESFGGARVSDLPSLVSGFGVHFLDGPVHSYRPSPLFLPVQSDMPPRLFDFSVGIADRRLIRPTIGYDIVFRTGVFSDFEGSAEDGVRFPSHAVTFWKMNRHVEFVLGIDYLDRDDITLLPVAGAIWSPTEWLRVEAVFPRPRLAAQIMNTKQWLFVGGELGGGTWAVERVHPFNVGGGIRHPLYLQAFGSDKNFDDNATYRDLRLVLGWESVDEDALSSSFEIGYVFDRKLSYRNGVAPLLPRGDYEPSDGFMMRMTARY